jgi:predicted RNase H-like nuclease (RuvC/YqgF family)
MRRRHGAGRMSKDLTKTVRIRKIDKVAPDHRGRSVWLGKVEPVELELVSTAALEKILKSEGGGTRSEIRKLAAGRKNGILARESATGHFRILSEADLRRAAPLSETTIKKADELSLVSTQVLRKVVPAAGKAEPVAPKRAGRKDKFGGFNPYDNN